jgi:hypothetical protein
VFNPQVTKNPHDGRWQYSFGLLKNKDVNAYIDLLNIDLFELHNINRSLSTSELEIISYCLKSVFDIGDVTIYNLSLGNILLLSFIIVLIF